MMIMKLGIENVSEYKDLVSNRKIGLVTNFTGMTSNFKSSAEQLNLFGKVLKIFTPEHGMHGVAAAGESVDSYFDKDLNLEVVSLYGDHRAPTVNELSDIDILVFDIQDIGVRYYTYIYTLLNVMQVATSVSIPVIVMDRPLPLGREKPLGDVLTSDFFSFVGLLGLPNRYGMTIGELAAWIKDNQSLDLELHISRLSDWDSSSDIKKNGLPWVSPSPNLPTFEALKLYPGLCFLEGTNVSEGRGTVRPFEQFGAPWINAEKLSTVLADECSQNDSIGFQPVWFEPLTSKYEDEVCQGVQIHIKNDDFDALSLGYGILKALSRLYPDKFTFDLVSPAIGTNHHFIEYLSGKQMRTMQDLNNLLKKKSNINMDFANSVSKYLLY